MRKPLSLTILTLTLLAAASRQDQGPLVDLIAFAIAIPLYLVAPAVLAAVMLSPYASAYGIWLYIRHRRGHSLPRWISSVYGRAARRWPVLARLAAARCAPAPASACDEASEQPDAPASASGA